MRACCGDILSSNLKKKCLTYIKTVNMVRDFVLKVIFKTQQEILKLLADVVSRSCCYYFNSSRCNFASLLVKIDAPYVITS